MLLAAAMPTMRIQHDVISYNATIATSERLDHWQRALHILHSMPGAHIETDVVGSSCCKGGGWPRALRSFQALMEVGLQADVTCFNGTLNSLEHWPSALTFCSEAVERGMSDVVSHNTCLRRLADDWRRALWLLGDLPKQGVQPDAISRNATMKVLPSVVSYGTALSCAAWQAAIPLLQEMRLGKIRSNCYTFASFLTSLEAKKWSHGLEVLKTMDSSGTPWDLVTSNAAVTATDASWQSALGLLRGMESRELRRDVATFSSAAKAVEWQLALVLEESAQLGALRGNQISSVVLLSSFLSAALWECAIQRQRSGQLPTESCNVLISCLSVRGRWSASLQLLSSLAARRLEASASLDAVPAALGAAARAQQWRAGLEMCFTDLRCLTAGLSTWRCTLALLAAARQKALELDAAALSAAMQNCPTAQWRVASELFQAAVERRVQLDLRSSSDHAALTAAPAALAPMAAPALRGLEGLARGG